MMLLLAAIAVSGCEGAALEKGKSLASRDLFDPGSAEFRDVVVRGNHVCGQINGKNRLGAYTGFRGFIVNTDTAEVIDEPTDQETGALTARYDKLLRAGELAKFGNASYAACGVSVLADAEGVKAAFETAE
jgi:hypothetical protein